MGEKQQTNKPERKKIESIPVVPQSTKMTKKKKHGRKQNKLLLNVRLLLFESKKMSFPIAHIYKQFLVRLIQRCVLLCNLIRKKKTSLRLCANFTTCLPAVYYNVFVTKKYPKPPYTLHTFKTHTEEERKLNEKTERKKKNQ